MPLFGTIEVGSAGPEMARIALLGQSPGHTEEEEGEPFVGRVSVESLHPAVANASLVWEDLYRTNVFKCRLLAANEHVVKAAIDKVRNGIVNEFLRLVDLRAVVTLGNEALYCVTRRWGITRAVGEEWTWNGHPNKPRIIPTVHPSYVSRTQWDGTKIHGKTPMWWLISRLERAKEVSHG